MTTISSELNKLWSCFDHCLLFLALPVIFSLVLVSLFYSLIGFGIVLDMAHAHSMKYWDFILELVITDPFLYFLFYFTSFRFRSSPPVACFCFACQKASLCFPFLCRRFLWSSIYGSFVVGSIFWGGRDRRDLNLIVCFVCLIASYADIIKAVKAVSLISFPPLFSCKLFTTTTACSERLLKIC